MRRCFLIWLKFLLISISISLSAQDDKMIVYLIPGQGADSRQFEKLKLTQDYEIRNVEYFTPEKHCGMKEYAKELSHQIDTTKEYILIGVSLGGMLASELGDFLFPEKIILISSAKCRNELPGRYRFQKVIPLNKLFPAGMIKWGAKILQPIVEPDSKTDKAFFKDMLDKKDPLFLKRTVAMIINWEKQEYRKDIIHIHGDNDHTIPSKNVNSNYLISEGSHMMVFTRADEVSDLINSILSDPLVNK